MAQYNILVSGNQLIIELIVTNGDFAPNIVSLKNPSIKLTTDRIKFFDSGVYNMALFFNQINEIDGVAPTDLEDAADKIIALIANFNGGGAAPYKVYTALLTQSGTNAPVATVLENTLGNIVWSYDGVGEYIATSNGLFTEDKTYLSITPNQAVYYEFAKSGTNQDKLFLTQKLQTTDAGADDLLIKTPVEIRVYN